MTRANAVLEQDGQAILLEKEEKAVCDFCSAPLDVTARCFLATGAQIRMEHPEKGSLTLNSDAHWMACPVCAPMVVARDRAGVLKRSKEEFLKRHGEMMEPEALAYIQEAMFWQHFEGEEHPAGEHLSELSI